MSTPPAGRSNLLEALAGTVDIMFGKSGGQARIDFSSQAIAASFGALVIMALIDASFLSMSYDVRTASGIAIQHSKFSHVVLNVMTILLAYFASMAMLYLLCRSPEQSARFPLCLAVHNWAAPIFSLLGFPLILLSSSGDPEQTSLLPLIIVIMVLSMMLIGSFRVTRTMLGLSMGRAALYFLAATIVSLVVSEGLQSALGLSPSAESDSMQSLNMRDGEDVNGVWKFDAVAQTGTADLHITV